MKRKLSALLPALVLLLSLSACGGSGGGYNGRSSSDMAMEYPAEAESYYAYDEEGYAEPSYYGGQSNSAKAASLSASQALAEPGAPAPAGSGAETGNESGNTGDVQQESRPPKLILTASLELETVTFDETAAALEDLTARMGGYFENANSGDRGSSRRWASYSVRIPSRNFDAFLSEASELCHELRENTNREDISERYYDTAGRLKTQTTKLDRLQALLSQADSMEDIITIMSAISETEERIDELTGELRRYDNRVDYSTIDISLNEVYRLSNVEVLPESYGDRLGSAFVDGLRDFAEWIEDITVALAYSWLWLVILAAVIVGVVKFSKRSKADGTVRRLWKIRLPWKKKYEEGNGQ